MNNEIQCELCGAKIDNRRLDQHARLTMSSMTTFYGKGRLFSYGKMICKECEESLEQWMAEREKLQSRSEARGLLWRDGGDCYICPICGEEVNSPARYHGCRCPKCGFQAEKDKGRE